MALNLHLHFCLLSCLPIVTQHSHLLRTSFCKSASSIFTCYGILLPLCFIVFNLFLLLSLWLFPSQQVKDCSEAWQLSCTTDMKSKRILYHFVISQTPHPCPKGKTQTDGCSTRYLTNSTQNHQL